MFALVLAVVGVYGVMSHLVSQGTHDIGVRMALGAERSRIVGMVLRQGAELTVAGIVLGLIGAAVLTRVMATLLFGVGTHDLLTFSIVPLVLGSIALLAVCIPALRATRVDPVVALRGGVGRVQLRGTSRRWQCIPEPRRRGPPAQVDGASPRVVEPTPTGVGAGRLDFGCGSSIVRPRSSDPRRQFLLLVGVGRASQPLGEHFESLLRLQPGDALDHEREGPRQLRVRRHRERALRVEAAERLGGVPRHQRLIVVVAILGAREQRRHRVPAFLRRYPLQGARDVQADEGRSVCLRHLCELAHRRIRRIPVFRDQLHGPGAYVFVLV